MRRSRRGLRLDALRRGVSLRDAVRHVAVGSRRMSGQGDWLRFGASTATQRLSQLGQKVGQAFNETAMRRCVACGESYIRAGMWTCAECTQLGCRNCLSVTNLHGPAAPRPAQQILCKGCQPLVKKRCAEGNARLRLQRIDAFLGSHLEPYTYDPESKLEQTLRLSGYAMQGLKKVSGFIPWAQAAQAIEAGYYLVRYGPLILAGNEIMESFQLILGLAKKLELPSYHRLASPDFFGGLYYSMGEHWGMRGRVPDMEMAQHAADGEVPVPDHGLLLTLRHLTRLLLVSKESTPTDAQRLLRQAMPGAELVLAEFSGSPTVPSFFLVCAHQARVAYLVMPGTRNLSDLVTDFNAAEEPFGTGQGHRGMIQSARWMEEQVGPALIRLYTSGFRITILGHSLGAGVGAFLTLILRPQISNLYCYGFGTPACVDEQLMPSLLNCMVSVVNRDDLVPRLSVKSVQGLLESVLCPGQVAKTQAWMKEDWQAVKDLERVVELRRRGQVPAEAQELGDGEEVTDDESAKLMLLVEAGVDRARALRALRAEHGDVSAAMLRATTEEASAPSAPAPPADAPPGEAPVPPGQAAMQRLGGLWQALRDWEVSQQAQQMTQLGASRLQGLQGIHLGGLVGEEARVAGVGLLVPGQVIHLYRHNGLARAARCAAGHEVLTRIIPSQEMLHDHKMESYARALHQACRLDVTVPAWESFDQRELCACCDSDFTWAYVLQSEPQKMLARHHCFACGRVVCEGCSRKRLAHERLGFQLPVRTCDRCAFLQFEDADDALRAFANEEEAAKNSAAM
ncbi:Diacylglycerol lipase-alpha (DAGL-alpha) (DGL-alpha) (Neural stem cell-derived dendrite regulator) (Sn1-specific diacylglycerol lipase alpha) [Durusdinium trenchii]|uniref:Diacylglycerol lipase-alpha (DAGL-alpha) (DGL-alpha) (Neural stem cell-derived dendrite regulator) (Sn1-specific diacylglycerol lipase alpha) n=1 Tax=Durusdinium trenchii TaxID=1381693 RepID=A0ABP0L852_9DINO